MFKLHSDFKPTGDQPQAIEKLTANIQNGVKNQVLLGVTGSGKSLTRNTPVLVYDKSTNILGTYEIGKFIDSKMSKHATFLTGDTELIQTSAERLDILTLSFNPNTYESQYKRITQLSRHISPKYLYRITTSCGREVTVTGDHNLWVLRQGELILLETEKLQKGDHVPIPKYIKPLGAQLDSINTLQHVRSDVYVKYSDLVESNIISDFNELLPFITKQKLWNVMNKGENIPYSKLTSLIKPNSKTLSLFRPKGKKFKTSLEITDSLLKFLGLYIAEGNSQSGYILISAHEKKLQAILIECLSNLDLYAKERNYNPGDFQISHSLWAEFLGNICGKSSYKKKLPSWFMQLSNKQLGVMLSAYFSGDGYVNSNSIAALTASKRLSSDLSYALLRFGIVSRIYKKKKRIPNSKMYGTYYEVVISGQQNITSFYTKIGFLLERKQTSLKRLLGKKYNTNVDIIPISGSSIKIFRKQQKLSQKDLADILGTSRSYISLLENDKRSLSRNIYKKLVLNFPKISIFPNSLLNSFWTPVKEVKKTQYTKKYVYDFSVEDNETFLAGFGGLFVHNTFTTANVIANINKPTLILSHNKTLAAQLYQEYRDFFPQNAVEFFVSYYDYYQPESYLPSTDTYIEKDADINEEIDKLRLAATTSLITRKDVIIVASVSCIYNLGSPAEYSKVALELKNGMKLRQLDLLKRLDQLHYERNEFDFKRGTYRVRGDVIDVFPAYLEYAVRLELLGDTLVSITFFDPFTGDNVDRSGLPTSRRGSHTKSITQDEKDFIEHRAKEGGFISIYPAKHYITAEERRENAIQQIEKDLFTRIKELHDNGKTVEAYRLKQKTLYDLEMIQEIGYCKGIENYSRYFDGRKPGQTPYTLMDFFPKDFLLVVDESHITLPQVRGMYKGDFARKKNLIDFGFRLPSAYDNRPLNFDEFTQKTNLNLYTSATPNEYELSKSKGAVIEQLIRPTGIIDPKITTCPIENQIKDLKNRIDQRVKRGQRVLVTALTKRMAEELASFLLEAKIKVTYLHSDVATLERTNILDDLRRGNYDVLVGINLLREGLDLPEVSLVAILDADKEGFLRSESSLIQTMGRAARHVQGEVVMYANNVTGSMKRAIKEVDRRRAIQQDYNKKHNITPKNITKPVREKLIDEIIEDQLKKSGKKVLSEIDYMQLSPTALKKQIKTLEKMMKYEAEMLNFEQAALLRDKVLEVKKARDLL